MGRDGTFTLRPEKIRLAEPDAPVAADETAANGLMRLLHTIKGSARMAGAMRFGQMVHDMETRVEEAIGLPEVPETLVDQLLAQYDQAFAIYEILKSPSTEAAPSAPGLQPPFRAAPWLRPTRRQRLMQAMARPQRRQSAIAMPSRAVVLPRQAIARPSRLRLRCTPSSIRN